MDVRPGPSSSSGSPSRSTSAIAIWSRARRPKEFYVAGGGVSPVANGMATAADWMSAASFISMAGLISFMGYDGSVYLMGWTGGYVLLALLLAPYLRKFGKFTVPDFVGDRYYSQAARLVAVLCAIFVSLHLRRRPDARRRRRLLALPRGRHHARRVIGMGIVFFYAVLGGMKGITYTQVAQYCVLIFAYIVPAIFISLMVTGTPSPSSAWAERTPRAGYLLDQARRPHAELGFAPYTAVRKNPLDVFCITAALMVGTAGLPHVIIRFYTVPTVREARDLGGMGAALHRDPLHHGAGRRGVRAHQPVHRLQRAIRRVPEWFRTWEDTGWSRGTTRTVTGDPDDASPSPRAASRKPVFLLDDAGESVRGPHGERSVRNVPNLSSTNELHVDRDIMVLANPEIAGSPRLGGRRWWRPAVSPPPCPPRQACCMVISSAVSHDLLQADDQPRNHGEGRALAWPESPRRSPWSSPATSGVNPPDYVAAVVAFAFGLAASSRSSPPFILGIFSKRMNAAGAVSGMLSGHLLHHRLHRLVQVHARRTEHRRRTGGSRSAPEGIGTIGMLLNFAVAIPVALATRPPSREVQELVDSIRIPAGAGDAHELSG